VAVRLTPTNQKITGSNPAGTFWLYLFPTCLVRLSFLQDGPVPFHNDLFLDMENRLVVYSDTFWSNDYFDTVHHNIVFHWSSSHFSITWSAFKLLSKFHQNSSVYLHSLLDIQTCAVPNQCALFVAAFCSVCISLSQISEIIYQCSLSSYLFTSDT